MPSTIVSEKETSAELASEITIGQRIPSVKVLNQADARPWHLQELLPSNGRWRVLVFTGNVLEERSKKQLNLVAENFAARHSFWRRFTPAGYGHDVVFELFAIHNAPRHAVTIFDFPEIFRMFAPAVGWDYSKIYVDDMSYHEGHGRIYESFGISEEGCIMIVRPDQHVSYVGPLSDPSEVTQFFSRFMIAREE